MKNGELVDIPTSELVELMDYLVWNVNHSGHPDVRAWRQELLARVDAEDMAVVRAVAVCDEYLAPDDSAEARAAAAKAWPDVQSR